VDLFDLPSALAEDLRFDEDWGIRVQTVDPLPGQPGLAEGDFIVAIDGALLDGKCVCSVLRSWR